LLHLILDMSDGRVGANYGVVRKVHI